MVPGNLSLPLKRTLNRFIVNKCWIKAEKSKIGLAIHLERLTQSFWISVFIPSTCLILAAEITLFIDDVHFEALIMVALTSNLVMYTLYSSIQEELPADSSLKLIEIWLLHGLLMPMIVFIILVINKLIKTNNREESKETKTPTSLTKTGPWLRTSNHEKGIEKKNVTFGQLCKIIVPLTSVLFMATFFAIGLLHQYTNKAL